MVKLISFVKFLPEISREVGQEIYEREHAPLVVRLLPMIAGYRRNYFPSPQPPGGQGAGYDVMTELCFKGPEALSAFRKALQGEAGSIIGSDAKRFMQSDVTVTCPVVEKVSAIDALGPG
jgi:EthD domain